VIRNPPILLQVTNHLNLYIEIKKLDFGIGELPFKALKFDLKARSIFGYSDSSVRKTVSADVQLQNFFKYRTQQVIFTPWRSSYTAVI
jgi:hypothetical protein